jgi:hypothetical protein
MGETIMIAIYFDLENLKPEHVSFWENFTINAKAATDDVVADWEEWLQRKEKEPSLEEFSYKFNQDIWKGLKTWLLEEVFHGKCAYCESKLDLDRYLGDVEHFRPKGRVTSAKDREKRERVTVKVENGFVLDHPGYFWLAYDWRNLMPACSACNSRAKADQFPANAECLLMVRLSAEEVKTLLAEPLASKVYPELYYLSPEDLDQRECPLLLNPLNPQPERDPCEHLRFSIDGSVLAVESSELGENSINVFNLNRDTLKRERKAAIDRIHAQYLIACREPSEDNEERLQDKIEDYVSGVEPYSGAALYYIECFLKRKLRRNQR